MKRFPAILLTIAAAAAGFGAGLIPDKPENRQESAGKPAPPPAAPARPAAAAPLPVEPLPSLPDLQTVDDCRAFLLTADRDFARKHPLIRRAARDFALRRWLELDAESALTEAERRPGFENALDGFAADLFRVWLDLNADSAVAAWNQANPVLAKNVRAGFLTILADKDPKRALTVWETGRGRPDPGVSDGVEEIILRRWAAIEPRQAAAKATTERALTGVLETWARSNPQEALAFVADSTGRGTERDVPWAFLTSSLLGESLRTNPALASRVIAEAGDYALVAGAGAWVENDAAGALQWAEARAAREPFARLTMAAGAARLAATDPERALTLVTRLTSASGTAVTGEPQIVRDAVRTVFASLAATDSARARELLEASPELVRQGGLNGLLDHAFSEDPAAAVSMCRDWLTRPGMKDDVIAGVLESLATRSGFGARDPGAVIAAVPGLAEKVDARILTGWARSNPISAARFIADRAAAGQPVDLSALKSSGVIAEIAIAQPEFASLWLQRLPDPDLQFEAATTLAANWSAFDPEAAVRWLDSLPDGPLHEAALAGYDRVRGGTEDVLEKR